jgi:uncharacterized integral membrane protein
MTSLRRLLAAGTALAVLVMGWSFAAANSDPVRVSLVFGEVLGVKLWAVLVVSFAAGALACGLSAGLKIAQLSLLSRRYRRLAERLESEVRQLRNLPLAGDPLAAGVESARGGTAPESTQEASGRGVLS